MSIHSVEVLQKCALPTENKKN